MNKLKLAISTFILLIAFGAGLYTQRVHLSDLARELQAPALPPAVGYEQVSGDGGQVSGDGGQVSGGGDSVIGGGEETTTEDTQPDPQPTQNPEPITQPPEPNTSSIPTEFNLAVPFTSQAPFGNWDEVHEETCEEASLYMVHAYYEGKAAGTLDPTETDQALLAIVDKENEMFGYYKDTTAEETGKLAQEMYGYASYKVLENPTVEDLKKEIAAGHPVIIPAAGRELGNPYFTAPGPIYHMLVLRGYTKDRFIANDPGTRRGEAYVYSMDTIMNALHDWNGGDVGNGAKRVLVVYPNDR